MSDAIGSGMPGISGAGAILSGVMPYPTPHVPPFPTPTLVQPVAQLRQPYIVTLTNQVSGCNTFRFSIPCSLRILNRVCNLKKG